MSSRLLQSGGTRLLQSAGSRLLQAGAVVVYLDDTFNGTAGAALSAHTADSGDVWPNDSSHINGPGFTLSGTGTIYDASTAASTQQISSASMPTTKNFQIIFDLAYKSALAGGTGSLQVMLFSTWPGVVPTAWFGFNPTTGCYFNSSAGSLATTTLGPAVGVTWRIRVNVVTAGSTLILTAEYSTDGGASYSPLLSWTLTSATTPSYATIAAYPINVGPYASHSTSTAPTATTGLHLGSLTLTDLPVLTAATLTGPVSPYAAASQSPPFEISLDGPAPSGGKVFTLASTQGGDTFQATPTGGNVTTVTIPQGQSAVVFYLTPSGTAGARNISISSPGLGVIGSPVSYTPLTLATGFSVSLPAGGHEKVQSSATVTCTPAGSSFTGTVTATPSGAQVYAPSILTFTGKETSLSFSFTPGTADTLVYTFANSGGLTNPSPGSYVSTDLFVKDTFSGSSGTGIASHTSDTLPSGLAGSGWSTPTGGAINLDGTGAAYPVGTADSYTINAATFTPLQTGGVTNEVQIDFDLVTKSIVASQLVEVIFMRSTSSPNQMLAFSCFPGSSGSTAQIYTFTSTGGGRAVWNSNLAGAGPSPSAAGTWKIRITLRQNAANPALVDMTVQRSTDGGVTYGTYLTGGNSVGLSASVFPSSFAAGLFFQGGGAATATTGTHVGNLTVKNAPPPPATCSIASAYVGTSGRMLFATFKLTSNGATVNPTAQNAPPAFLRNGVQLALETKTDGSDFNWITGVHTAAGWRLAASEATIATSDVVTLSVGDQWMTCGSSGSSAGAASYVCTNNRMKSCFGTETLPKTLRIGYNLTIEGPHCDNYYIQKNWRYKLFVPFDGTAYDSGGYPTTMAGTSTTLKINNTYSHGGNAIDFTDYPGIPGVWAIGFDDGAFGTSNAVSLSIVSINSSICTVTPLTSVSNTGTSGAGQYYAFTVARKSGATDPSVALPIGLQINCTGKHPQINNLWILAPGDFTYTPGTPLTFDRSDALALSAKFLADMAGGVGMLRFMASFAAYGGNSSMVDPWQLRAASDWTWDCSFKELNNSTFTSARPLLYTGTNSSPYFYTDFAGNSWPAVGTLGTAMNATDTTTTITISSSATDPIFAGLWIQIDSEKMRVKSVSGTSVTVLRGAEGTTAATHSIGAAITIGKRTAWYAGNPSAPYQRLGGQNSLLIEFVMTGAHNFRTMQEMTFPGGVVNFTTTDGVTFNVSSKGGAVLVTGANTFAQMFSYTSVATVAQTLASTYAMTGLTTSNPLPEPGYPVDGIADMVSRLPGCGFTISIPPFASDSFVIAMANALLAVPAGRAHCYELANEWWNSAFGYSQYRGRLMSQIAQIGSDEKAWQVRRTDSIRTVLRSVYSAAGRLSDLVVVLGSQFGGPNTTGLLMTAAGGSAKTYNFDALTIAPYFEIPQDYGGGFGVDSVTPVSMSATDIAANVDIFIHQTITATYPASFPGSLAGHKAALAAVGRGSTPLHAYEGGYDSVMPFTVNDLNTLTQQKYLQMDKDAAYTPEFRIIQKDLNAWMQKSGFQWVCIYAYNHSVNTESVWGTVQTLTQVAGMGDGSDGLFDNRLCLATPGLPGTKSPYATVNQDANCVSTRLKAIQEWNAATEGMVGSGGMRLGGSVRPSSAWVVQSAGGMTMGGANDALVTHTDGSPTDDLDNTPIQVMRPGAAFHPGAGRFRRPTRR